jgi:hypothetical protein
MITPIERDGRWSTKTNEFQSRNFTATLIHNPLQRLHIKSNTFFWTSNFKNIHQNFLFGTPLRLDFVVEPSGYVSNAISEVLGNKRGMKLNLGGLLKFMKELTVNGNLSSYTATISLKDGKTRFIVTKIGRICL